MTYPRIPLVLAMVAGLALAACRSEAPEPPAPEPMQQAGPDLDSLRAYEDSVRMAQEAAARLAAQREADVANARSILEARVHFDYDESTLRPDAEALLRQKVTVLRASPQVQIRIEGHADERGSADYNVALGNRRAQSVVDFFAAQGIPASRFQTTSFGEERPLMNQSNEAAWAQNRRAEFIIFSGGDQINPGN